jgi:RpiR family transcriptional regulator, carbohydrate utilization regulator
MDIVWQLRQQSAHTDAPESKLARFILDNLHVSAQATMESLATQAGVSTDVLRRFAESAGCRDLDDFLHQVRKAGQHQEGVFIDVIRQRQPSLTQQENRVAVAILNDTAFAASATIEQLAGRAEVSAATITRFARSVGCEDIRDLRMRLARASSVPSARTTQGIPQLEAIQQALAKQWSLAENATWERAARALQKARSVLLIGAAGQTTPLVAEVDRRLSTAGLPLAWIQDDNLLRMTLSRLQPDDLLLLLAPDAVSSSVLSAVHHAHIQKSAVIAICPTGLDLANQADIWLPLPDAQHARSYGILCALDRLETALASF